MSEGKAYLWSDGNWYTTPEITAHDEVRILRAERDRLREALKMFVDMTDVQAHYPIEVALALDALQQGDNDE